MNAFRVEFGVSRSISIDTSGVGSRDSVNPNPSPVKILTSSNANDPLPVSELSFDYQPGTNAVNQTSFPENVIQNLQESFAGFFGNLSNLGRDDKSSTPPSIVAGLTCGLISLIPNFGQYTLSIMTQSVHKAYAGLAFFIGPNGDQIARNVFSGIALASAAVRTVFPMVKEVLLGVQDPNIKLVSTVISFALAAGHLLVSTIALAIATNNLPALVSKDGETGESKSNVEKIKEAINHFFDDVEKKLDKLNEKGLVGWLGVVREWLLTSAAVVGFLSALPLLVKTVGTIVSAPAALIIGGSISLVAGIVEFVQGYKEYRLLSRELKELKLKKEKLLGADELLKLQAAIEEKEGALLASKVRIGKGAICIVTSIASIVLGVLAITASISVPFLPAVMTAISVLTVVVYVSISIALTEMRKRAASAPNSDHASMPDIQANVEPENPVSDHSPSYSLQWQR
jgi:hypothetical protein